MKYIKRISAVFLAMIMIVTSLSANVMFAFANSNSTADIKVQQSWGKPGTSVEVNVEIENNPGIIGALLSVNYDDGLTLVNATTGSAFAPLAMTNPGEFKSPCNFSWDAPDIAKEDIKDGVILTLTFEFSETVTPGTKLNIGVSADDDAFIDSSLTPVELNITNNEIIAINYLPGDVNNDGKVNMTDVVLLRRDITGGYNVSVNKSAEDVNADGKVNMTDVVLIRRYITGGYGVVLLPSELKHTHTMEEIKRIEATCTDAGNIAYWHCTECDKYFTDVNGVRTVTLADTIIPAKGHTEVIDPYEAPTYDKTGLTEGSHCSVCNFVIKKQEVIPKLEKNEYAITYHIANNDKYLQSLDIENPNPTVYTSEDGLKLSNLNVDGYVFEGWYDGQGANGELVKNITIGEKGNIDLYAKWTPVVYNVQYKSDIFVDKAKDSYTVNEGLTLSTPRLSNYTFTGWTDENGTLYKDGKIPVGTTGTITLTANWTSERNKTFTKPKLDAPIIVEDESNNTIFFTYEIGEIQNVPVYTVYDFGYIAGDGITQTRTETYSTKISDTMMQTFSNSVSNATTKSSDWTLSKDWNESTSIDEQSYTEKGLTKEEAETIAKSSTDTWNISSGSSGSSSHTTITTNQNGWENQAKVNLSSSHKDSESDTHKEHTDNEFHINGKVEYKAPVVTGSIDTGYERKWGSEDSHTESSENSVSGGFEVGGAKNKSDTTSDTSESSSSWNSSSSFGGSTTNSTSKTTSNTISEKIAKTYGYGKTYALGGGSSESQGLQSTQSENNEYESSVTYSKDTSETITSEWTTQSTKAGYHRWIMVGQAHVFAIVGYNMATKSFFTYTYSVMDDTEPLKPFEDYSYTTGNYNDAENGVIPFEIPFEVAEYVSERTSCSAGLKIDQSTGIITEYNGTDTFVVIPEYMNVGNGDVVKVTGISPTAFKGNTSIKEVRLSDFITEIPDNSFEGCTSLFKITGGSITSIGSEAFKDCSSMEIILIDNYIKSIGENAFVGCERLLVNAANAEVAEATVNSGAKNIQLYINGEVIDGGVDAFDGKTLEVPQNTESFALCGYGYTYPGLSIVSNANSTIINKTGFNVSTGTPLKTSSSDVVLNQVTVDSNGLGIIFTADNTNLLMQGNIAVITDTDKSVLGKNIVFGESNDKVVGTLNVSGNIYVNGKADGSKYLARKGDEIVYIDDEMYNNLLNPHTVVFNANGGTVSETQRTMYYGQMYNDLPVPEREFYTFDGWFTEPEGGSEITEKSTFEETEDIILFAHWTLNTFNASFNANGGIVSETNRTVVYGSTLGTLPTPTRDYYTFDGWFTAVDGGEEVTADTVFTSTEDVTYYAHWTLNPLSDWTKASEMPSDAVAINTKYSYTQRSYTTSGSSSMSGWTKYDTKRTSWGGTQGPVYSNPSNGSRNVWSEQYETGRTHHYVYYHYANSSYSSFSYAQSSSYNNYREFDVTSALTYHKDYSGHAGYRYYHNGSNYYIVWLSREYDDIQYGTRWYYQDPVYTYYYYKDENKEATTDPTGQSNVSNVQEWVQYRVK